MVIITHKNRGGCARNYAAVFQVVYLNQTVAKPVQVSGILLQSQQLYSNSNRVESQLRC